MPFSRRMESAEGRSLGVRAFKLSRPEPSEAAVLSAVMIRLQYDRKVAWARRMNSGAYSVGDAQSRRFVRFGFPGCSDILGQLRDGRLLAIEVKRPSGRSTSAQDAFLALVRANGGISGIVRSVDDLEALLSAVS